MSSRRTFVFRLLLYCNIITFVVTCVALTSKDRRSSRPPDLPTYEDKTFGADRGNSAPTRTESEGVIRARLEERLRAASLAKFEASFETQDPLIRLTIAEIRAGVYREYASIFREFNLTHSQLERLVSLLVKRRTEATYKFNLPDEIIKAGVSSSYKIGPDPFDADIRAEFGEDIFQKVLTFELDVPYFRERLALCDALASFGANVNSQQAKDIQDALKSSPVPKRPNRSASENEWGDYFNKRLSRLDWILDTVGTTVGKDAREAIEDYLLDKEEVALGIHSTKAVTDRLREKKASTINSAP